MKEYSVTQGSGDWFTLRLGIPTASCFDQIITPKIGKLSASARKYAYRLLSEKLLNAPGQTLDGLQYIERGNELEPQAVAQYEFAQEVRTRPAGFFTTDDGLLGASPDRMVIDRAIGVECKCPAAHTMMMYLLEGNGADEYRTQVQGQMLVAELERVDFYAFHPRMPPALIVTPRDEEYIGKMRTVLGEFNERLAELMAKAKSLGVFQAFETVKPPLDAERGELMHALQDDDGFPGDAP